MLSKGNILVLPKGLYSRLVSKTRDFVKGAISGGNSVSRKEGESRSPIRRYQNLTDGGADGVILTQAAGGSNSVGQFVAGRDVPLGAISIRSTVEIV